jgi:hypothetical protein
MPDTARAPSERFEAATYRKVSWRLVPFLVLCYVVAYLDRVNVGFAKLSMPPGAVGGVAAQVTPRRPHPRRRTSSCSLPSSASAVTGLAT